MAETEPQVRLLRFGNFEVDLRSGELRKAGVKLKFGGQPLQVLSILLERPGEVVTREELQKRLWPDTFVDVDHNLNTAINKIREVLGDSAESPRFVETLPRRGYRFIGELEPPVQPVVPVVTISPDHGLLSRRWLRIAAGVVAIVVVALAAVVAIDGIGNSVRRSRRPCLLFRLPLCPEMRFPRPSLPTDPGSLSRGMVIQRAGPRGSTYT